jgi:hypothetical protein
MLALSSVAAATLGELESNSRNRRTNTALAGAYYAGLWLQDIHRGLLWRVTEAPQAEGQLEASSWSWISFTANIRWPQKTLDFQRQFRVLGICTNDRGNHDSAAILIKGQCPELYLDQDQGPDMESDPKNQLIGTWTCLHFRCRLLTVQVRGYLTKEQAKDVAELTQCRLTEGSSRWRAVCSDSDEVRIAGWGSLEQLETVSSCADAGLATSCLLVATRKVHVLGHWGKFIPTVTVVILTSARYCGRCPFCGKS